MTFKFSYEFIMNKIKLKIVLEKMSRKPCTNIESKIRSSKFRYIVIVVI